MSGSGTGSKSMSRNKEGRALDRTITRVDDYEVELLAATPTEERGQSVVTEEAAKWDGREPRGHEQIQAPWEQQNQWGHERV